MKKRNMKHEVTQKTFNDELEIDLKVKKYESCGRPKFQINISEMQELLTKEYNCKFNFDNIEEADDEDYDYGIEKLDMSVKMSLDEQILHVTKFLEKSKQKKAEQDKKQEEQPKSVIVPKGTYFGKVEVPNNESEDEKPKKRRKSEGRLLQNDTQSKDLDKKDIPDPFAAYRVD
jgi:hypothetical protein